MVCGSINEGCDSLCNCCGCFGTCCCGLGKEKCCDWCNHCFCLGPSCCECMPCGMDGCMGYPNPLCGCCGNCNLMWYASCCPSCFVADMLIATDTANDKDKEWSNVVCTCITLWILASIFNSISRMDPKLSAVGLISAGFQIALFAYFTVIFGYAATKIAQKKGLEYEPAECCTKCYDGCCTGWGCCSSCWCCLTFCCCYDCHFIQVARTLEKDDNMKNAILDGRPQSCKCCNCWDTAEPLELMTGTAGTVAHV